MCTEMYHVRKNEIFIDVLEPYLPDRFAASLVSEGLYEEVKDLDLLNEEVFIIKTFKILSENPFTFTLTLKDKLEVVEKANAVFKDLERQEVRARRRAEKDPDDATSVFDLFQGFGEQLNMLENLQNKAAKRDALVDKAFKLIREINQCVQSRAVLLQKATRYGDCLDRSLEKRLKEFVKEIEEKE